MNKSITFEEALDKPAAFEVLKIAGFIKPKTGSFDEASLMKDELREYKKELMAFAIEHWGEHIVCDKVQLALNPTHFMNKGANATYTIPQVGEKGAVLLKDAKIEISQFLNNLQYQQSGKLYVYKEKETIAFQAALKEDIARREEEAENEALARESLVGAMSTMARNAKINKTAKAEKAEKKWVVNIEGKLEEYEGDMKEFNADDYLCSGSKALCQKFIDDEKKAAKKNK